MKLMHVVALQAFALLAAVAAGNMLNNDLVDGPRELHRLVGISAGLLGIAVVAMAFQQKVKNSVKALAVVTLVFTFIAASSGAYLDTADNYDKKFNMMRMAGTLALITSVITLTQTKDTVKSDKSEKKSEKEE